ncbi:MAG: hypothetical protein U0936_26885 [Planctomycetaceae bacterium]
MEPSVNTRAILDFNLGRWMHGESNVSRPVQRWWFAAAVTVLRCEGQRTEVETFARNVTLENCTFERSGKFMWDYGYLWQITVWPEDYNDDERAMAAKYFRTIWSAW